MNKYIWDTLAYQTQTEVARIKKIVEDCCTEFADGGGPLLVNDGEYLYSASLIRRMEKVDKIIAVRREAARKRWSDERKRRAERGEDAAHMHMQCKEKESKGEESKGKESREEESRAKKSRAKRNAAREAAPESGEDAAEKATEDAVLSPDKGADEVLRQFAGDDGELLRSLRNFARMRREKGRGLSSSTAKVLVRELRKIAPSPEEQAEILDRSTAAGWSGVYPLAGGRASGSERLRALRELRLEFEEEYT